SSTGVMRSTPNRDAHRDSAGLLTDVHTCGWLRARNGICHFAVNPSAASVCCAGSQFPCKIGSGQLEAISTSASCPTALYSTSVLCPTGVKYTPLLPLSANWKEKCGRVL